MRRRSTAGYSGQNASKKRICSLDDVTKLATEIIKPLADVSKHIQDNIALIQDKKLKIETKDPSGTDLMNILTIPSFDLVTNPLSYPQTVCGSIKCMGSIKSGGKNIEEYKTICHDRCSIKGVPTGCQFQEELKNCEAMSPYSDDPSCTVCSCSWEEHMHRTYTIGKVEKEIHVAPTLKVPQNSDDISEPVQIFKDELQVKIENLEDEQKVITQVSAQVATFLEQNNAPAGSSRVTASYLDHQINVQQNLVTLGNSPKLLESMKTSRSSYNEQATALQRLTKTGKIVIKPENILESVEKLYNLPETGDQIRRMIEAIASIGNRDRKDSVGVSNNYSLRSSECSLKIVEDAVASSSETNRSND